MTRYLKGEAAIQFGYDLAAAAMAGRERPKVDYDLVSAEDVRIGSGRYFQELTDRLTQFPAKASDDPAVQQEMLTEIRKTLSEAEVRIADAMFKLVQPARER